MSGPNLMLIDDVPYISVGDAITLARLVHGRGATAEHLANALAAMLQLLVEEKAKPKPKKKPTPKKKEKSRAR